MQILIKMNLTEQTVSGTNEVIIQDALNASLFKLKLSMNFEKELEKLLNNL